MGISKGTNRLPLSKNVCRTNRRSVAAFESLETRRVLATGLLITEFQAINDSTLADGDGNFSDWIELHNPTADSIDLAGWHLTDDRDNLSRWPLPELNLDAGEYLVVFASGEEKVDAAGNYHTNFRLSGSGEDLLLVEPDGVTYDDTFLSYPEQSPDVSYGVSIAGITETLLRSDSLLSYRVPTAGEDSTEWTSSDFEDHEFIDQQTVSASGVLVTEVGTGDEKFVEIQNVSGQPIHTHGWTLAVNDPTKGPSGVLATQWSLPPTIQISEILYRTDQPTDQYWGAPIPWQADGPGWVMILDDQGIVRDFLVWGYSDAQIDAINVNTGLHANVTVADHWQGQGADLGTVGGVVSQSVAVGPGADLPEANDIDSAGIRLNIEPTYLKTLAAGTYDVQEISFATSSDGEGEVRAFLAIRNGNAPSYETIWASSPTRPPAGDAIHSVAYEAGSQQFTLPTATEVYAGVWHDGDARVRFSGQSTITNHDNSPIEPTSAGQIVSNFSHGDLNNRTYAYGVTIGTEGAAKSTLVRTGIFDSDSSDDFVRVTDATVGTQNPDSGSLFGGIVSTRAGIGFNESHNQLDDFIQTDVATDMLGISASLWTRFEFETSDQSDADELILRVRYDDGFQAYLNGVPLASRNTPQLLTAESVATASRSNVQAVEFEDIDVSQAIRQLGPGRHVLAVHVLNASKLDADLLFQPELLAHREGVGQFYLQATPGAATTETGYNTVADTKFSVDRGFYESPFEVEITTETAAATIVFTLDGSPPEIDAQGTIVNGNEYVAPLTIGRTTTLRAMAFKRGLASSNIDTQTYLFTNDVAEQTFEAAIAAGLPARWGIREADYGIDPDVVGPEDQYNGIYTQSFAEDLKSLPTLSLVMDTEDMFGPQGIYSNVGNRGEAWERPVSAELVYPDGRKGFQVDAGIRMHGGASRSLSLKNNFRLLFREEYGASKLDFPLFGDGVDRFDTLVLRAHFNDGWGWSGAGGDPLFSRDEWHRQTQAAMGHIAARGVGVHLYINGTYWGLYNPSERPDASFAAQHLGGDKSEWDAMNHNGVVDGNSSAWDTMLSLAAAVDRGSSATAKWNAYQRLQGKDSDGNDLVSRENYLDIENYIDYLMLSFYSGNDDWPNRNWYAARKQGADSEGFQFFAWDSEISMDLSNRTHLSEDVIGDTNNNARGVAEAYGSLRGYEEFQLAFADRVHQHFFNGGVFYADPAEPGWDPGHPERNPSAARMAAIASQVADAVVAESARWGDQHRARPYTRDVEWQAELDHLLNDFFPQRSEIVLDQLRSHNLYPEIDAPEYVVDGMRRHGGYIEGQTRLAFEPLGSDSATIWYTTDGSDPRLPGGEVNAASAIRYAEQFHLHQSSTIKARIQEGDAWSALSEAVFAFDQSGIRVAELQYNPAEPTAQELAVDPAFNSDDFEFLELVNVAPEAVDLTGMQLAGGVQFSFGDDQQLAPGERIVIVQNIAAFSARYAYAIDSIMIAGEYQSALSNAGERIRLVDALGQVLVAFEYSDSWWDQTDGDGYSLVVREPTNRDADLERRAAWRPSGQLGGTPGSVDQGSPLREDFDGSGRVDFADFLQFSSVFGSVELADLDPFDLDESGDIGFGDFLLFSKAFGKTQNDRGGR